MRLEVDWQQALLWWNFEQSFVRKSVSKSARWSRESTVARVIVDEGRLTLYALTDNAMQVFPRNNNESRESSLARQLSTHCTTANLFD